MPQPSSAFRSFPALFLALFVAATVSQSAGARTVSLTTEANVIVEVTLAAEIEYADPFNEVTLDAVFTDPLGKTVRVPAFWAGGSTWKIRFSSPILGKHS